MTVRQRTKRFIKALDTECTLKIPAWRGFQCFSLELVGIRGWMKEVRFFHPFDAPHVHFEHTIIPLSFSVISVPQANGVSGCDKNAFVPLPALWNA
jgi:hypothetical protein